MAITPFYRELFSNYPGEDGMPIRGQNFHEHTLYALRTRMETDPEYSAYANSYGTSLGYRNRFVDDRVYIEIVIRRVQERDPNTGNISVESISPDWLQKLVDRCLMSYPDYAVVISDQYEIRKTTPIGEVVTLPSWWLAEVMPRIDISSLIRDSFESLPEEYDYFYENGCIYVRLIDSNKDSTGPYTPSEEDLLNTGEKAIKRGEASYGDYSDFHVRYMRLHIALYDYLIELYERGVVHLESESSLIKNWELCSVMGTIDLYEPLWRDVRLIHYDGAVNLLRRQFPEFNQQWDSNYVYLHVGEGRVLKHLVANYVQTQKKELATFYDSILALKVSSLKEAKKFANRIDEFKDTVSGSVIPRTYLKGKKSGIPSVYYYEMSNMNIIQSTSNDITLEVVSKRVSAKEVSTYLSQALEQIKSPKRVVRSPKKLSPLKTGIEAY